MGKAEILNNKGMIDLNARRFSAALASFDKAIELNTNYSYPWGNRAIALWHLNRESEALESVNQAISLDPINSKFWNTKGCILIKIGNLNEAETCLRSAISIDPRNPEPWTNLGSIYFQKGELDLACTFYDSALSIDKKMAGAWFGKGQIANKLKDTDSAITFLDRAIEIDASDPVAWTEKGFALAQKGDLLAADRCFDATLRLDPDYPEAIGNKGETLRRLGKDTEAEFFINKAIEKQPSNPNNWNNKGALFSSRGLLDEAMVYFDKALALHPNHPDALSNKIGVLGASGRFAEAEKLLATVSIERIDNAPHLPPSIYVPKETTHIPLDTQTGSKVPAFCDELIRSTLVALRGFQASRPTYVREFISTGISLRETDFRDEFKRLMEMRFENIGAECKYGDGLADVRIQKSGSQLESMIFEFKVWGRNDYLDVVVQLMKYVTSFEAHATIVMVNPNKKPLFFTYAERIILCHPSYVANSLVIKPFIPDSNIDHYLSKHTTESGRIVTVFHFILDIMI